MCVCVPVPETVFRLLLLQPLASSSSSLVMSYSTVHSTAPLPLSYSLTLHRLTHFIASDSLVKSKSLSRATAQADMREGERHASLCGNLSINQAVNVRQARRGDQSEQCSHEQSLADTSTARLTHSCHSVASSPCITHEMYTPTCLGASVSSVEVCALVDVWQ